MFWHEIQQQVMNASAEDKAFLLRYREPVLRKLMSSDEIKRANQMVKKDWLVKGRSDDGKSSVIYYLDVSLHRHL